MIFPTASAQTRPVRLSEPTREWAWRSMHGEYGDEALSFHSVSLDDLENYESLSALDRYDAAILRIARNAPVRICPEELVCGSATLGLAISHKVPALRDGRPVCDSVSHLTIRYDRVLREGLVSYENELAARMTGEELSDGQRRYLKSLENVLQAIRIYHGRYLEATKAGRPDLHALLEQVPFAPARGFREAVQSLWFIFSFVRLCGNWPGIGRLDWLLGDYLRNDLASDTLTMDEAREIMASFFIKGCEWIVSDTPPATGDAQHYQNIVLAGVDEDGLEIANDVTRLTLDVVEELGISDYPITVRLNARSPQWLLRRIAEVMRHGGGIVAVYNEDLILQAMLNEGYPLRDARCFANDGCWEVQVPGRTNFGYFPFDALQIFNRVIGVGSDDPIPEFSSIEEIYAAFRTALNAAVEDLYRRNILDCFELRDGAWRCSREVLPSSVIDLFEDSCLRNAASYFDLGTDYAVRSPHIGGAPDVSNSLYALERAVFAEKKVSFKEMILILRSNWEGAEELRQYVRSRYTYYGNDSDEADRWHSRVLNDFADMVHACGHGADKPVRYIPGVSTFGRQVDWLPCRAATVFGFRQGEILSGNDSPTPGTDGEGATSMIRSYCKTDLVRQSCGAALDVRVFPKTLAGENGLSALMALIGGFLSLGGFFMQLDAVEAQTLREAQENPERFKTLSVRVSGWNARFVTLNREWQNMVIERTAKDI